MSKTHPDPILTKAYQLGIKINFAESSADIMEEGIHVFATDMEKILEAVSDAVKHGCDLVMVHCDQKTWPFQSSY